jgi:hypothetical protein
VSEQEALLNKYCDCLFIEIKKREYFKLNHQGQVCEYLLVTDVFDAIADAVKAAQEAGG